jgi:hypothetical protein
MCIHEMNRAIALDPKFALGLVVPVLRDQTPLPLSIASPRALYADLRDDSLPIPWRQLLAACGAALGTLAPEWLRARDETLRFLERNVSVNLVIRGLGAVAWRGLLDDLTRRTALELASIDLHDGRTAARRGLVEAMLSAIGAPGAVPMAPEDLVHLSSKLSTLSRRRLAICHCDALAHRSDYGTDFFAALRYAVMDRRQLVLLLQSRAPISSILPGNHPLSEIQLSTVELLQHS